MKIIEALKELKIIEKKMMRNFESITRYSSIVSIERPHFDTEAKQRQEVKSYLQANIDLQERYRDLKKKIERTNLEVKVELLGQKYTLSDLLIIKRKIAAMMIKTYRSLNDTAAEQRLINYRSDRISEGERPKVVRFYDEEEKNKMLRHWQDLNDIIDSRLEVINATTDLIE